MDWTSKEGNSYALAGKDSELNTTKVEVEVELWEYIHREWR